MSEDLFQLQFNRRSTFITELSIRDLQFISQALHIYKLSAEFNTHGIDDTIEQLILQTSTVERSPEKHHVYANLFDAPPTAIGTKQVYFVPVIT